MSIKFPNLKRFFSLFLAAVMMVSLLAVNAHAADRRKITDYGDAYGHWAYESLTWAVDNGVLVGTSEDRLNPDGYLTRAQMAAMIDRLFGTYKSADISRFTDVPRGSWYHDYIAQAVHMGTFAGYSNSRMGPNENITREQAMVVLARTVCLSSAGNSVLARFPDRNQVGAWAADSVAAMVERGYVSGYNDGRLNPKGQITRAEMAQIMSNIFQSVHDSGEITGTHRDTILVRGAVSIKDAVFESDLILANGLGEKALDLNNITVKGRLVVWGGSAVNISGKSTVASVVTPRNDGPVQVVFDAAAAELSKKDCSIVYPSGMDKGNKVLFTDKADKPAIAFDLPAYRYVGDSVSVKTTLTGAEAVAWELTRDGKPAAMPEGFTKDGGICYFMEAGRYTLKGTVENSGGTAFCEKTVDVLPIGDIAFSLPEYSYTDRAEDVKLLTKNDLTGSVVWTLTKDGANQPLASFTNDGGTVIFPEPGEYTLTATLRDSNGKTATASQSITIIFKAALTVTAPDSIHIGTKFPVGISGAGSLPVSWGVKLGGRPVTLDSNTGFLSNDGGTLALYAEGTYTITATVRDDAGNLTSGFTNITVTNTAPVIESFTANATRNMKDGRFYADLNAVASDPDGDAVHLEWSSEYQQDGYYEVGTHTIRVRAVDEWGAASAWESRTIEFINNAPVITSFTASVTRQTSGNNFFANVSVAASDPDGDTVRLEWGGDYVSSGWYSRNGSHTIRVRAVDAYGAASPWQEKTIEFVNQAPSKPVISRNPANGVVRPSQAVTITARSTDPEGDAITYEWDGRDKETTTYGYGKHLIKCRAVDAYGAASPWSAIVFFVADDVGGGMTLTSANSFIEETGINFQDDGETIYGYITEYTFDVPPVSGHNGSDYGRVEAYNIRTGQWDEIAYKTTNNGVTLSGKLPTGTYTQMRFYYYTNHDCMYNKSNITYSIVFDF